MNKVDWKQTEDGYETRIDGRHFIIMQTPSGSWEFGEMVELAQGAADFDSWGERGNVVEAAIEVARMMMVGF